MRAICGLKADATRERRRVILLVFRLREGDEVGVMKERSRREDMNWTRLEEISERV